MSYGNFVRRMHIEKSEYKSIRTRANLLITAVAGACTVAITQGYGRASVRIHGKRRLMDLQFSLDLAFILSLLCFIIMHASLLSTNTTSVEVGFYEKKGVVRWKYDLGRKKIFKQIIDYNVPGGMTCPKLRAKFKELMHSYHRKRGPPRCAFKVDTQKAYDTLDWRFLDRILQCFGFPPTMIKWIMTYRRVHLSESFRFHHHYDDMELINIYFADDLFIFARGDTNSAREIMDGLDEFKLASGLVLSIPKSTAFFFNVHNYVKLAILNSMPFSEGKILVKYLGVSLISSRLLNKDCKVLVDQAKTRIGDWKNKSLSFASRLQLCASVISSMQVYWASVLLIPKGIIYDIQQLTRGFLWCNGEYKRGKAKVAWDVILLPKTEGGLGIRSLEGEHSTFLVSKAWEDLRLCGFEVRWARVVWFSHCIPRHALHLWLTIRGSLKTKDKLGQGDVWDADLSLLRCLLCKTVPDSHFYLFFECNFSSQLILISNHRTVKSIIRRLVVAATTYFIWIERNNWLFKNSKRSPEDVHDLIMITVRLKLLSFRFKNTAKVKEMLLKWNMPNGF
ncbi:reverse transcriptase domain, reverse transcriptase zinc-binding domain protein [Tanacetum coccineum]